MKSMLQILALATAIVLQPISAWGGATTFAERVAPAVRTFLVSDSALPVLVRLGVTDARGLTAVQREQRLSQILEQNGAQARQITQLNLAFSQSLQTGVNAQTALSTAVSSVFGLTLAAMAQADDQAAVTTGVNISNALFGGTTTTVLSPSEVAERLSQLRATKVCNQTCPAIMDTLGAILTQPAIRIANENGQVDQEALAAAVDIGTRTIQAAQSSNDLSSALRVGALRDPSNADDDVAIGDLPAACGGN